MRLVIGYGKREIRCECGESTRPKLLFRMVYITNVQGDSVTAELRVAQALLECTNGCHCVGSVAGYGVE